MEHQENFLHKITKIRNMLSESNFSALEICSQANFSWLTRGRGFIGLASVAACGSLFVTDSHVYLVAENIEAQRLYREQMDSNPFIEVLEYPWNEPELREKRVQEITQGRPLAQERDFSSQLLQMRSLLSASDLCDYKSLCYKTADILETVCKGLRAGITDYALTGEIAKCFWEANIEPITILIAFDERTQKYRHPVPNGDCLKNYAVISVCGRRNGLIASVTRNVLLQNNLTAMKWDRCCANVAASIYAEMRAGVSLNQVFERIVEAYEKQKASGEYRYHHQGGLTGFIPRELRAGLTDHCVRVNEAYAFNPTLKGSKCEDTILVTDSGIEVMTHTGNYPYYHCVENGKSFDIPATLLLLNRPLPSRHIRKFKI